MKGSCTAVLWAKGSRGRCGEAKTRLIGIPTAINEASEGACKRKVHYSLGALFSGRIQKVAVDIVRERQGPVDHPDLNCRSRFQIRHSAVRIILETRSGIATSEPSLTPLKRSDQRRSLATKPVALYIAASRSSLQTLRHKDVAPNYLHLQIRRDHLVRASNSGYPLLKTLF